MNDVTGRSELGVMGFRSDRILSGHTEPSAEGHSEARHPQAGAGGGVERALDWTSGTWGFVQLCLVGRVPSPLWASVFPSVKCRGVTRRPCMGAFQLRNSCVSKKSSLEFCCSSLWTSSGWRSSLDGVPAPATRWRQRPLFAAPRPAARGGATGHA